MRGSAATVPDQSSRISSAAVAATPNRSTNSFFDGSRSSPSSLDAKPNKGASGAPVQPRARSPLSDPDK